MLLEKNNNPSIGEIITVKLFSGEEIVGKLAERTIDSVFLSKPISILMHQTAVNQVGISFGPVLGSVHDVTLQIPLAAMSIRPVLTGGDVKRNYLQATSGLVTPTAEQTSIISAS
jgi:hypothetical protein